jgi:hypothetical protein
MGWAPFLSSHPLLAQEIAPPDDNITCYYCNEAYDSFAVWDMTEPFGPCRSTIWMLYSTEKEWILFGVSCCLSTLLEMLLISN